MTNLVLKISTSDSAQNVRNLLSNGSKAIPRFLQKIGEMGNLNCEVQLLNNNSVAASATLTMDHTNQSADDTIQVGIMTLTAKASGASGAQFNIGASDSASAINLAAAINSNSSGLLFAQSSASVVTVRAASPGTQGNAIPIILTQGASGITASGAALSGGSTDTSVSINYSNF